MEKNKNRCFVSNLTGKEYDLADLCRVPDRRLQTEYIKAGFLPREIYASKSDNMSDIIVMLFDRNETQEIWGKWIKNNPKNKNN